MIYINFFSPLSKLSVLNSCAPIIKKQTTIQSTPNGQIQVPPLFLSHVRCHGNIPHNMEEKMIAVSFPCDFKWPLFCQSSISWFLLTALIGEKFSKTRLHGTLQPDMSKHHWYPEKISCAFCLGARIELDAFKWSSRLWTQKKLPLFQQKADLRTGSECMDFRHGRQNKWFGANVWSQPCVLRLWDYEANAIKPRRGYKCKYCVQHWYAFNNVRNFQYIHACINIFDGFIFMFQICSRSYIVCALHCQCLTYSQPVHTLLLSLENDDKMWVNQTTLFP